MWLPPYLGSYEQLLNELLHPHPQPHHIYQVAARLAGAVPGAAAGPSPDPWRAPEASPAREAVAILISAATAKEAAAAMADKARAKQIVASAEATIADALDDYCGTPPRKVPWPFPGPPPWVWDIASQLTTVGNTLQEGALRTSLLQMSGRVLDKGLAQTSTAAAAAGRG